MGFEPATLRIEATNATTRPTNVDVDKQRARARLLIANANLFFLVETGVRLAVFSQLSEECNSLYFRAVFLYTRRI